MNYTRVDHKKLRHATTTALAKIKEVQGLLEPLLVLLTDAQRGDVARSRKSVMVAVKSFAKVAGNYPELVAVCDGYDPEAVREDLDNVEVIADLRGPLEQLLLMLADSALVWQAEAYVPSVETYGVAKNLAKKNPKLAADIAPFAEAFAVPSKQKKP